MQKSCPYHDVMLDYIMCSNMLDYIMCSKTPSGTGLIIGLHPANERRRYNVTPQT